MTKTVTISALRADSTPYAHHDVIVTLVAGSAGGVVGSNVVVESSTVKLDADGEGSIVLETNEAITSPATSFYRFTVADSSPTITRSVRLTDDLPSTVSWTLADIQVGDPTIPQRDVSSDYVTIGGQSLTNYLADHAANEVARLDLILAVAATDGSNTSWDFLTPDAGAGGAGLVPDGWVSANHLDGTGAQFAGLLAMGGFGADDPVTLLVPGGSSAGVWRFTPATIEDPWSEVPASMAYAVPSLSNGLAGLWVGADNAGQWETVTDEAAAAAALTPLFAAGLGGNWAIVGRPNDSPSWFTTPTWGSINTGDGWDTRAKLTILAPQADVAPGEYWFAEWCTRERQAAGEWGGDQDDNEDAVYGYDGRLGLFVEDCLTSTPPETEHGEDAAGRLYSLPPEGPYDYRDPTFRFTYGDVVTVRKTYLFDDGNGNRVKTLWREVALADAEDTTADGRSWKRVVQNTIPGVGSIADSDQPWAVGINVGATYAIEFMEGRVGIDGDLVLDFRAADAQPDGTVVSSLVTHDYGAGPVPQTWTHHGDADPLFVDTRLTSLAAALAGGGGGGLDEAAVQALIDASVAALIDGAPGALDTLNELAAAINDDASFAAAITTALAGKVPLSTVDAAGDLLIGTANDTVGRLPIGTARKVLTSDGSTASWANAAGPSPAMYPVAVGQWFASPHESIFAQATTLNRVLYVPVWVPADVTAVDGIQIEVTTVGSTGAVVRLGLHLPHATTKSPDSRVIDGGTVDATSGGGAAGVRSLTIASTAVTPNSLIYVSVVSQGATATLRYANSGLWLLAMGVPSATNTDCMKASTNFGWFEAGVSGGFGTTASPTYSSNTAAQVVVGLRRA